MLWLEQRREPRPFWRENKVCWQNKRSSRGRAAAATTKRRAAAATTRTRRERATIRGRAAAATTTTREAAAARAHFHLKQDVRQAANAMNVCPSPCLSVCPPACACDGQIFRSYCLSYLRVVVCSLSSVARSFRMPRIVVELIRTCSSSSSSSATATATATASSKSSSRRRFHRCRRRCRCRCHCRCCRCRRRVLAGRPPVASCQLPVKIQSVLCLHPWLTSQAQSSIKSKKKQHSLQLSKCTLQ